jgi:hypothetical protein
VSTDTVVAQLAQCGPDQSAEQLTHALDAYLDGQGIELVERCNLARAEVWRLLATYQTKRGRLRALGRYLAEIGIPQ